MGSKVRISIYAKRLTGIITASYGYDIFEAVDTIFTKGINKGSMGQREKNLAHGSNVSESDSRVQKIALENE
ncbi:hypothetical protein BGAL_0019g00050 [Botrytis galanthina]|uniref:Uncharacterized protein n=1 Tax=Botrytis galanthina TaxID=278940 RepID=A0A4S8RM51_9HELO|nr:hypothetical protein BGAL_0019g00050 [Botrytis galanthina]